MAGSWGNGLKTPVNDLLHKNFKFRLGIIIFKTKLTHGKPLCCVNITLKCTLSFEIHFTQQLITLLTLRMGLTLTRKMSMGIQLS